MNKLCAHTKEAVISIIYLSREKDRSVNKEHGKAKKN